MPQTAYLLPIKLDDSTGLRFAKLAAQLEQIAINAGISYSYNMTAYLSPINLNDSEGVRFAKLQAWLQLLANNISGGGGGGGPSGVDATVTSLAQLAAVTTTSLTPPVIKVWAQASDMTIQIWILQAGTDTTAAGSIQRPNDYNGASNAKCWYKLG